MSVIFLAQLPAAYGCLNHSSPFLIVPPENVLTRTETVGLPVCMIC